MRPISARSCAGGQVTLRPPTRSTNRSGTSCLQCLLSLRFVRLRQAHRAPFRFRLSPPSGRRVLRKSREAKSSLVGRHLPYASHRRNCTVQAVPPASRLTGLPACWTSGLLAFLPSCLPASMSESRPESMTTCLQASLPAIRPASRTARQQHGKTAGCLVWLLSCHLVYLQSCRQADQQARRHVNKTE